MPFCGVIAFMSLVVVLRSNLFFNSPSGRPCLLASSLSPKGTKLLVGTGQVSLYSCLKAANGLFHYVKKWTGSWKGLKLAIETWMISISIAMSRCIVVNEENLLVWGKTLVGLHQEILKSLGSHASCLGGMVHQTSSWGYSNYNGYIPSSLPAYLSVGLLSFYCSAIASGSPDVTAVFIYEDAMTDHDCIERSIGLFKTALNHIWAVSNNW